MIIVADRVMAWAILLVIGNGFVGNNPDPAEWAWWRDYNTRKVIKTNADFLWPIFCFQDCGKIRFSLREPVMTAAWNGLELSGTLIHSPKKIDIFLTSPFDPATLSHMLLTTTTHTLAMSSAGPSSLPGGTTMTTSAISHFYYTVGPDYLYDRYLGF